MLGKAGRCSWIVVSTITTPKELTTSKVDLLVGSLAGCTSWVRERGRVESYEGAELRESFEESGAEKEGGSRTISYLYW